MKIIDNKIVEATPLELYKYWLHHWSDVMSYSEYLRRMKKIGVKIIEDK